MGVYQALFDGLGLRVTCLWCVGEDVGSRFKVWWNGC